jgi:hypothetical protein
MPANRLEKWIQKACGKAIRDDRSGAHSPLPKAGYLLHGLGDQAKSEN